MRFAIFALAATTIAADVSVVWRHEKTSGSTSLTIHSENDAVLAETCGNTIGSLDFHVDEHGAGTFTAGGNTFDIQTNSQNGVSCNRIYNGDVAVVECSNVKLDVPQGAALTADCFHDENAKASFRALKSRSAALKAPMDVPTPSEHGSAPIESDGSGFQLRGRQIVGSCGANPGFELTGNGNPHQNYFHKQLSENIFCGASPSCLVGQTKSKSFSIGFSTSGSADGWFSAGFDVQQSWSTGNDYQCYGASGDTVCVWYNTAHTAYTGRPYSWNSCDPGHRYYRKEIIMKSPNKANRGGGYYCVVGACRAQGDGYWDNSGRAGGP